MRVLTLATLIAMTCLWAEDDPGSSAAAPSPENVNSRYIVESVEFSGALTRKLSKPLRAEANRLVGENFDPSAVAELARRIREELHVVVTHRVEKGLQPEHVKVVYEGKPRRWDEDDAKVTKLAYHQKLGWTGGLEVGTEIHRNRFEFGIQTDADRLVERYAGLNVGFSRPLATDRVRLRFEFEASHQQWNPATQAALEERPDVPGIYRERFSMEPSVVVLLTPALSASAGFSIQHFQTQFPAAHLEASNAVMATLRHRRRWGSSGSTAGHELDAGYSLRAATNLLDSDFVYTRHAADGRYALKYGHSMVTLRASVGTITGRAPLFDRFSIGNSQTLRGWNRFDVDPLGGSRMAHGSVQYRYRWIGVFYDTGAVWDREEEVDGKHSTGVVIALGRKGPYLTVGIPLRTASVYPLFMMSMNF